MKCRHNSSFFLFSLLSLLGVLFPLGAQTGMIPNPTTIPSFAPNEDYRPVHANELIENATAWDGEKIDFEGEIIGDIMLRGSHVWINVLDGSTAIGIWASKSMLPQISFTGQYFSSGDHLKIRGTMHRACAEHGGDLDIHADLVKVLSQGKAVTHPVGKNRLWICFVSIILAGLSIGFWRHREKKLTNNPMGN
ncbi:MAG: hypothetical protein LLF89_04195 [Spirochaetaceae bacterium]|nr:hypothetical protein [Spirochaetaceae bacterium]